MSTFWSVWVIVIVLGTIFGCAWLLLATRKGQTNDTETENTTGHSYDGIEEYDNPLPKWWFYLYLGTCVFALGYLALYPGLGNYEGLLGWTSTNQWEAEVQEAEEKYGPIYAQFGETAIPELAQNEDAMKIGQRLFANNCSVCHGTAARGQVGFPNLTDDDWLWGGEPEQILHSIANGRQGNMTPKGVMPNMTNEQVDQVVNYVLSFSGREQDAEAAEAGAAVFAQACTACHGADGTGMQAVGAPNLTDNIWLYGSTYEWIKETVVNGRQNQMPAQKGRLTDDQIHILAAYVYSLSN
ncbi:MAG: cytochrome-c oxidase, cbb3-type subunit III [Marinobacter sp.]|uniref:cytochrome-c oxidase, cbb3-type subunit III n=1 Tax=unclassified Marinobacter TaxID=83889 RepID=UPI00273AB8D8|nr:cytochrome-c oxidase, cbb3-type subunit III [Marinobacter sp. MDS2]MDP4546577.1 cytochrome-c oxidase, cbb3-type subunit III [Marinobacter sp. MDS2]